VPGAVGDCVAVAGTGADGGAVGSVLVGAVGAVGAVGTVAPLKAKIAAAHTTRHTQEWERKNITTPRADIQSSGHSVHTSTVVVLCTRHLHCLRKIFGMPLLFNVRDKEYFVCACLVGVLSPAALSRQQSRVVHRQCSSTRDWTKSASRQSICLPTSFASP